MTFPIGGHPRHRRRDRHRRHRRHRRHGRRERARRAERRRRASPSILATSFDQLQSTQATSDGLAVQAATGDLKDVHDYMIASNEASLATEMVVAIKNKAVEAFNEIMRMPV